MFNFPCLYLFVWLLQVSTFTMSSHIPGSIQHDYFASATSKTTFLQILNLQTLRVLPLLLFPRMRTLITNIKGKYTDLDVLPSNRFYIPHRNIPGEKRNSAFLCFRYTILERCEVCKCDYDDYSVARLQLQCAESNGTETDGRRVLTEALHCSSTQNINMSAVNN